MEVLPGPAEARSVMKPLGVPPPQTLIYGFRVVRATAAAMAMGRRVLVMYELGASCSWFLD